LFFFFHFKSQIVEGSETLNKLEAINCQNQRPLKEIVVDDCGLYKFDFWIKQKINYFNYIINLFISTRSSRRNNYFH